MSKKNSSSTAVESGRRKRPIAKSLAEELGVSISTISRAFNPETRIAQHTRERILKYADRVGYRPDPYAQSLTTKKNTIVSIIVSHITNPFYPEVLAGLTEALRDQGFDTMLFTVPEGLTPDEVLPQAIVYQPEFVIVMSATISFQATISAAELGTSMIFFNRYVPDTPTFSVTCDNVLGGREIADHLFANGRQQLAFIAGPPDATTTRDRWLGFSERCAELGLTNVRQEPADVFSYEAGHKAALRLYQQKKKPDGIFCANDLLALGALDAIRGTLDIDVPETVAVVGFDNISITTWNSHSLTTYQQPISEMIEKTLEIIEDVRNHPQLETRSVAVKGQLIVRQSTACYTHVKSNSSSH